MVSDSNPISVQLSSDDYQKLQVIAMSRKTTVHRIIEDLIRDQLFKSTEPKFEKKIEAVIKEYAPVFEKLSKT